MAKETYYFSHDYGARNDPKLQKVSQKLGHEGKSVFWDLIEVIHEQGGYLQLSDVDNYAYTLRTTPEIIESLIHDFNLFQCDDKKFWSVSALMRITDKDEKSIKARDAAAKRWEIKGNADALQVHTNGIALKESKVKEIKVKDIYRGWGFFNKSFLKIWGDYLEMRVRIRKPATERAEELALVKLNELCGGDRVIAGKIVEQSIANSWQGLFPLKVDSLLRNPENGYPNYYSKKFEDSLQQNDVPNYWKHLRSLGYTPKKDNQQNVVDWTKLAS